MAFIRTPAGQAAKYLFYSEPLVWVEGPDDVPFYAALLTNRRCRIQPAGGKPECLKLAQALIDKDFPYVVAMDGDYGVLDRKRGPHKRVIYLHRYSIENYLFEYDPVERVAKRLAKVDPGEVLVGTSFTTLVSYVASELEELVILDVAHDRIASGSGVFPDRVENLLPGHASNVSLTFDVTRISALCASARRACTRSALEEAQDLVTAYLKERRLVDVSRGHFVLGLLRRLIFAAAKSLRQ